MTARPAALRAVIIGCGQIAGGYDEQSAPDHVLTHAKAYRLHPGTELVGVADLDVNKAQAFARRWEVPYHFGDPQRMLTELNPDLVSICTPDAAHAEWLEACLQQPIQAVWCEKPLTAESVVGRKLVAAYEARGVPLAVNYLRRWDPSLDPVAVALSARSGIHVVVMYGKGLLHNGSHAVDLLLRWLGPVRQARVLDWLEDYGPQDPTLTAWLEFENGASALLLGCDDRHYTLWEIDALTPTGRLRVVQAGQWLERYAVRADPVFAGYRELDPQPVVQVTEWNRCAYLALDNIVAAVRHGAPLRCTGRMALETLQVCEMIRRSAGNN